MLIKVHCNVNCSLICGKCTYFGIKEGIKHTLSEQDTSKYAHNKVSFNIDRLPVFKFINLLMWPLQCAVINIDEVKNSPFFVGLYSGAMKQNFEFSHDFMEEMQELMGRALSSKTPYVMLQHKLSSKEQLSLMVTMAVTFVK